MTAADEFRQRARRAYEWGRLRDGAVKAWPALLLTAVSWWLCHEPVLSVAIGAGLFALATGLVWYGQRRLRAWRGPAVELRVHPPANPAQRLSPVRERRGRPVRHARLRAVRTDGLGRHGGRCSAFDGSRRNLPSRISLSSAKIRIASNFLSRSVASARIYMYPHPRWCTLAR